MISHMKHVCALDGPGSHPIGYAERSDIEKKHYELEVGRWDDCKHSLARGKKMKTIKINKIIIQLIQHWHAWLKTESDSGW